MRSVNMERIVHKKPLIVLDFDETLVEQDSGTHLSVCLGPEGEQTTAQTRPDDDEDECRWRPTVEGGNALLESLRGRENLLQDIESALRRMTFVTGMDLLVKELSQDCDLILISGGCVFFIESFLKSQALENNFKQVIAHPYQLTGTSLVITEFGNNSKAPFCPEPHCCRTMCKGRALEDYLESHEYLWVAYIGDGANDWCPCTKLSPGDLVFARQGFPLDKRLGRESLSSDVKVYRWAEGSDIFNVLKKEMATRRWDDGKRQSERLDTSDEEG